MALARAITWVESTRPDHRQAADKLLQALLSQPLKGALRIGVTGPPGAGKSSLIERFGLYALKAGLRLAVLAIDPVSPLGGGALLGDKTRMPDLARRPEVFIRPSPAASHAANLARRSWETLILLEAADFELIFIETVGSGQSGVEIADLVDMIWLVITPGGGDELQGIKRGIMELADLVLINKADGPLEEAAKRTRVDYQRALDLLGRRNEFWQPQALQCSAQTGLNMPEIEAALNIFTASLNQPGRKAALRAQQARACLQHEMIEAIFQYLKANPKLRMALTEAERLVADGKTTPWAAMHGVLDQVFAS